MKKTLSLLATLFLLNGCAETLALLGPASSAFGGGNAAQSAISSAVSFGVKKQTGKSPAEHAFAYVNEHNPEKKKVRCVKFIDSTKSETCAAIKKNIIETKRKIVKNSNIKFLNTTP
jgi:hypothetical protein